MPHTTYYRQTDRHFRKNHFHIIFYIKPIPSHHDENVKSQYQNSIFQLNYEIRKNVIIQYYLLHKDLQI